MSTNPLHSSGASAAAANPIPLNGGETAVVPANVQAGPVIANIDNQTVLQQIAARQFLESQSIDVPGTGAKVGPLTGLTPGLTVLPGGTSQTAVRQENMNRAVYNALKRSRQLESKQFGLAASERFFWITLERTFNDQGEHLLSAEKVPTAEMSKALALSTNGVLSTNDLVEGINNGDIGYTSNHSILQSSRLESSGLKRRNRRS